ncbi:cyclic nucleotide-binding domain-containing protein [Thiohalobacter thiocyanaticus]|uniref:Cyclic nucleotide-binding domain-containing protein n=1 Tax=Thiohalobacter thiocyanaticus TaxID=585455 RepID=A0A426QEA0_9GAMM|nr:cyclic nucleotide-binding domain-containing protein [Thiohalobacter thiocyanaticus]
MIHKEGTAVDGTEHTPLFRALDDDDLKKIDSYIGTIELDAGDVLFAEGDQSDFAAFVTDGQLEAVKKDFNNNEKIVSRFSAGTAIGEMALLDGLPRSATIRAKSAASVTVLDRQGLDAIIAAEPHVGVKILRHLARTVSYNLRRTSNQLSDL